MIHYIAVMVQYYITGNIKRLKPPLYECMSQLTLILGLSTHINPFTLLAVTPTRLVLKCTVQYNNQMKAKYSRVQRNGIQNLPTFRQACSFIWSKTCFKSLWLQPTVPSQNMPNKLSSGRWENHTWIGRLFILAQGWPTPPSLPTHTHTHTPSLALNTRLQLVAPELQEPD